MKHEWLVRASSMGAIMSSDRSGKKLGAKCITEIQKMLLYNKRGVNKRIWTKYMEKGTIVEAEGIDLAAGVLGWFDVKSDAPKRRYKNEWIVGEPDIESPMILGDIKSSWDATTFPFFKDKIPNADYEWQMMSYMWLCDRSECELVYCLTNTPEHLIQKEIRMQTFAAMDKANYDEKLRNMDMHEIEAKVEREVRSQMTFDNFPAKERVKRWVIKRDEVKIEAMKDRITECRHLYDEYWDKIQNMNNDQIITQFKNQNK
tara:strand:+ start:2157 stop:2933 length:777 start_codon:yes stop_codon:yes gene_type:complete